MIKNNIKICYHTLIYEYEVDDCDDQQGRVGGSQIIPFISFPALSTCIETSHRNISMSTSSHC